MLRDLMQIKMATIFFVGVLAPIGALSTSGSRSHGLTLEKFIADLIIQNPDTYVFEHYTYVQEMYWYWRS
jgi:hypothetical protein